MHYFQTLADVTDSLKTSTDFVNSAKQCCHYQDSSLEVSDAVVKRLTVDDTWQFFSAVGNGADNQHNQLV